MKVKGYDIKPGADLRSADLQGADLQDAKLPHFSVAPEIGSFTAWKSCCDGMYILQLEIPEKAKRVSSLIGRKCRAEYVKVIEIYDKHGSPITNDSIMTISYSQIYKRREISYPDFYNDDIRLECTNGIHFYMTRREAEESGF